jgi:hypothetical protein
MQYAIERQITIAIENQPGRLAAIARIMALSAQEARELKARGREPVLTKTRWLLLKREENLSEAGSAAGGSLAV